MKLTSPNPVQGYPPSPDPKGEHVTSKGKIFKAGEFVRRICEAEMLNGYGLEVDGNLESVSVEASLALLFDRPDSRRKLRNDILDRGSRVANSRDSNGAARGALVLCLNSQGAG